MTELSQAEFLEAVNHFADVSLHLEMRDAYGTEVELPRMAAWAGGASDDYSWLAPYCRDVKSWVAAGKVVRRARIVSEPLSTYRQWSYGNATVMVEAGEDIRWVSRRLVSSIALPGNDFFLLDGRIIIFLHYAGNGLNAAYTSSTDPHDINLCASAFEAVWSLGVPHSEYHPA